LSAAKRPILAFLEHAQKSRLPDPPASIFPDNDRARNASRFSDESIGHAGDLQTRFLRVLRTRVSAAWQHSNNESNLPRDRVDESADAQALSRTGSAPTCTIG